MMEMVVCKLYKLGSADGKEFTKEMKQIERERCIVTRQYIDRVNKHYKTAGRYYEVDEQATEKNLKERNEGVAQRAKNDEMRLAANKIILQGVPVAEIQQKAEEKPAEEKQFDDGDDVPLESLDYNAMKKIAKSKGMDMSGGVSKDQLIEFLSK